VVYSGAVDNPLFDLSEPSFPLPPPGALASPPGPRARARCRTADIIAAAVGPSGPNSVYLFNLHEYLVQAWGNFTGPGAGAGKGSDSYLRALSDDVALRLGPWRALRPRATHVYHHQHQNQQHHQHQHHQHRPHALVDRRAPRAGALLGWGSHEFGQLGAYTAVHDDAHGLQPWAIPLRLTHAPTALPAAAGPPTTTTTAAAATAVSAASRGLLAVNPPLRPGDCDQVLAGGGTSAWLCFPTATLHVWGKLAPLLSPSTAPSSSSHVLPTARARWTTWWGRPSATTTCSSYAVLGGSMPAATTAPPPPPRQQGERRLRRPSPRHRSSDPFSAASLTTRPRRPWRC